MEFSYFIKLLKKKWHILAIASVLAAALTFALVTLKPREYYSKAQISAGITDNNQVAFEKSELSWSDINNKFNNFLEFLNSKEIYYMIGYRMLILDIESNGAYKTDEYADVKKTHSQADLKRVAGILRARYSSMKIPDLQAKEDLEIQDLLREMYIDPKSLKKVIHVSRIASSDYIKVEVKSKNPNLSSQLVNSFCEEAIRFHNENEIKNAEKSVSFFKTLLATKKEAFERKLDSLARAKAGSQVVDFGSQSEAQIGRISTLENSRNEAAQKITGLRRAISNIDAQLSESSQKSYQNNHTNNAIMSLKNRIEHLNDKYINSGFKNKIIADTIAALRAQLEKKITMLSNDLYGDNKSSHKELMQKKMDYEVELSMAEASLNTLDANIHANKSTLTKFVGDEAALTPLEMAVSVTKETNTLALLINTTTPSTQP
jgi:polysaccharide biosynthesis transport protein